MTAGAAPLDELLGYRDRVPLAWTALDEPPSPAELAHWQDHNLRLLAALALLEERPRKGDADEPLSLEVERLHLKFDLLLELLAVMLRQQQPLPPARAVRVTPEGMSWQMDGHVPAAPRALLQIHLHPGLPAPLQWPAEIEVHDGGEAVARFLPLGEACAAALERHVFTRHRRSVAEARSPVTRSDPPAAS